MKISINSKWGRGESRGNKTDHILITAEMVIGVWMLITLFSLLLFIQCDPSVLMTDKHLSFSKERKLTK